MQEDDRQLLYEIKQGKSEAYEIIFKKYFRELYRYAYNLLRDATAAEEVTQEIFLYVWEKRKKIEVQTTLKTYLYSAIKNKCLNYIKLELSKQQVTTDVSEVVLLINEKEKDNDEKEKIKRYVTKAIDDLPIKCRQIFLLSRNAGLTYDEIAEELGLSKKTVENQMGIALKKLRESLTPVYEYYKKNYY